MTTNRKVKGFWIDGRHYRATSGVWFQPKGTWTIWRVDRPGSQKNEDVGRVVQHSARRWQALSFGLVDRGTWRSLRQAVIQLDALQPSDTVPDPRTYLGPTIPVYSSVSMREDSSPVPPTRESSHNTVVAILRRRSDHYLVFAPGQGRALGCVTKIGPKKWKAERDGAPPFMAPSRAIAARQIASIVFTAENPANAYLWSEVRDDSEVQDDEEDEDEWPDDAMECPLLDTPYHQEDCELCGGREWVTEQTIEDYLGSNRLPCLFCAGEGWTYAPVPVALTWTCDACLGTGLMPVRSLEEPPLRDQTIADQDWNGADLRGLNLGSARLYQRHLLRGEFRRGQSEGCPIRALPVCRGQSRAGCLAGRHDAAGGRAERGPGSSAVSPVARSSPKASKCRT